MESAAGRQWPGPWNRPLQSVDPEGSHRYRWHGHAALGSRRRRSRNRLRRHVYHSRPGRFACTHRLAARNPHPKVKVYTRALAAPLDWDAIAPWFDDLSFYFGERLLRSQCVLRLVGETDPYLMQHWGPVYRLPTTLK